MGRTDVPCFPFNYHKALIVLFRSINVTRFRSFAGLFFSFAYHRDSTGNRPRILKRPAVVFKRLHGFGLDRHNAITPFRFLSALGVDDELTTTHRPLCESNSVVDRGADADPLL